MENMYGIIREAQEVCYLIKEELSRSSCIPIQLILKEKQFMSKLLAPKLDKIIDVNKLNKDETVALLYLLCIANNYSGEIIIRIIGTPKFKPYYEEVYRSLFDKQKYSLMGDFYIAICKEG